MESAAQSSSPALTDSDYERVHQATPVQDLSSAALDPPPSPPVTNENPYSSPVPFQHPSQWTPASSSSPRPQLPPSFYSQSTNPYELPLSPSYSSSPPTRHQWSHPAPYSPWAGIPSSFVTGGGRAVTASWGGQGFMPPSHLHIPHHMQQSLPAPWSPNYPPHSSFYSLGPAPSGPMVGYSLPGSSSGGTRRPYDSIDYGGSTRVEDEARASQRRKLDDLASLAAESDEEDDLDYRPAPTRQVVKGGQIIDSTQQDDSQQDKKPIKPKGPLKKGVHVDNPFDIPSYTDVKPFVSKLYYLLAHPDQFSDLICWDTTGTRIMIRMKDPRLAREVLPRAFGHNKPASLARQFSVYNFTVMRILKDSGLTPPTPSVSSALASSSTSEWRTYQRSDTFFSRDTFNDVEVLKQLLPKAAGGGGGTRRKKKGASSDSDESD